MPRPEKLRRVGRVAEGLVFKPAGRPARELEVECQFRKSLGES